MIQSFARSKQLLKHRCWNVTVPYLRTKSDLSVDDRLRYLNKPPYTLPDAKKIVSPPLVYIEGEEMTRYVMDLVVEKWIKPHIDIHAWKYYDLSCTNRDKTDDQVLLDAVDAGSEIGAIFKEPTITPTAIQVQEMGLSQPLKSPNGAMRKGWNGITISRDTIHVRICLIFIFISISILPTNQPTNCIHRLRAWSLVSRSPFFLSGTQWVESMVLAGKLSAQGDSSPPFSPTMAPVHSSVMTEC